MMGAQRGKDLLLKLDVDGTGTFESVAGLRATRIALNAGAVDVTTAEAPGRWRQLLAGAGVQSASVTGGGVFKDAASDAALRAAFFAGAAPAFRMVIPDFGVIEGSFQITELKYAAAHDGEATFEATLQSAGPLGFTAL
jgi:TP901-1 family phage major tail protein